MLSELSQYLLNPGSQFARKLGYTKELIAINARFKRNQKHWQPHLENTKKVIIDAAEQCKHKETVVILGAGLLFDIPLEYLAKTFTHVFLIDIVFAKKTKNTCRQFNNIYLIEHDLNGLEDKLLTYKKGKALPNPKPRLPGQC